MLFIIINSGSRKYKRTILIYLFIVSCLITLSSCTTTESFTVSPDSLRSGSPGQITNIILKNGDSVECENKNVEVIKKSDSVIVLSVLNRFTREHSGSISDELIIPLNDILNVRLNKTETDETLTILLVAGLLIAAVGLTLLGTFSFEMK